MIKKTVVLATAGIVLAGATTFLLRSNAGLEEQLGLPVPPVDANPQLLSSQEATAQRASHYQDVDSVAETLELPSNFARREALHVIAGRANAGQLRSLIAEARRISDAALRFDALEILLLRYVEVDPSAALESALQADRSTAPKLVPVVIGAWSRTHLDDAMAAARGLPDAAVRTAAARAIVASNPAIARKVSDRDERRRLAARLGIRETSDAFELGADPAKILDDPHSAIQDALGLPDGERRAQLARIAQAWAGVAPAEAWDYAANLPDAVSRIVFENAVIAAWAATQPELAFAHVNSLPAHARRDQLLKQVTLELARRDPVLAMQVVKGVKGADRAALQSVVVDEWARYDPASAAAWVEGLDRMQQSRYAFTIGESYVLQNRDEALAWALRISRSPGRNLWSRMLAVLAGEDPVEALRIAASAQSPMQRNQAVSSVLAAIAVRDPGLAASHLDKLSPAMRSRATMQIAAQMSETNSAVAVMDWLEGLDGNGRALAEAAPMLASIFAQRDPEAAAVLLDRVPKAARGAWISSIAAAYADIDVERGLQWVRRFQDDPDARGLERTFVATLARRNPDAALEVVERIADAQERDRGIMSVLPMIAMQSPETAVRYYDRIADEGMRTNAIQMLVSQWARNDPAGARKWVMSMPSSAARDNGITQLIQNDTDVNTIASLLGQMQSPDRRVDAVMTAAMRLQRTNPEEAQTLLRRFPLDPARQRQLDMMQEQMRQGRAYSWSD